MNRYARDKRKGGGPRPVQSIELSEKNQKRRLYLTLIFAGFGVALIVNTVVNLSSSTEGWSEITVDSTSGAVNCSEEFYFLYNLGAGDTDATTENKALTELYTELSESAYDIFNADAASSESANVYDINHSANETVTVDPVLYEAFELIEEYGDRSIYLGPLYEYYDNVFYCDEDYQTEDFDPSVNEETAAYYEEIISYAQDPSSVAIELLGDCQVKLYVSDEYLEFAEESGIVDYIDLYWMKNAFITDYIAESLEAEGYTNGCITSYDGFIRNLDDTGASFSCTIYKRVDTDIYQPATIEYDQQVSIVYLRDYMLSDIDTAHYYEKDDGSILSCYVDIADGTAKSAISDLVSYSYEQSCAEVLLSEISIYIADEWDEEAAIALSGDGIYVVYSDDSTVYYDESGLSITADSDFSSEAVK